MCTIRQTNLAIFVAWIVALMASGMLWADESPPKPKRAGPDWWSLQALAPSPVPGVKNDAWAGNPIDAFAVARWEAQGRAPAPPADRATLIRRLSFDLLGLPPTPAEIDAFVNDRSIDAHEKLVDRLLASPRYGERPVFRVRSEEHTSELQSPDHL